MITRSLDQVNHDTIKHAIDEARHHFHFVNPVDTFVIKLPAGTHTIVPPAGTDKCIDITGINPKPGGRFVLRGAGMDQTIIVTPEEPIGLYGVGMDRVTVSDIHFTRDAQMTTQGHVVEVGPGYIDIRIQPGFPSIPEVYDGEVKARDVRVYSDDPANPRVIRRLPKVSWKTYTHLGDDVWRLHRYAVKQVAPFKPGQLLGVRSKYGGQPYRLSHGDDSRFERVKWTRRIRGIFINVDNVQIVDCRIERPPAIQGQVPVLSGNGGGPQIWGKSGHAVHGVVATGNVFRGTGDDSLGLFNVASGHVAGNKIIDSFARGILLNNSPDVVLADNRLIRAPLQYVTEA